MNKLYAAKATVLKSEEMIGKQGQLPLLFYRVVSLPKVASACFYVRICKKLLTELSPCNII